MGGVGRLGLAWRHVIKVHEFFFRESLTIYPVLWRFRVWNFWIRPSTVRPHRIALKSIQIVPDFLRQKKFSYSFGKPSLGKERTNKLTNHGLAKTGGRSFRCCCWCAGCCCSLGRLHAATAVDEGAQIGHAGPARRLGSRIVPAIWNGHAGLYFVRHAVEIIRYVI